MVLSRTSRVVVICVGILIFLFGCLAVTYPTIRAVYLFLGFDHPKEYLVLLQNNTELRASGGFMGSYARVQFVRGAFHVQKIEDIYVPDGALQGHVDPPLPIQLAFGQGWFRLRDSNWNADFPTAAATIQWFFEHGGESRPDGIIAINLTFVHELLRATGPLQLPHETEAITVDTVYARTQAAAELGFFPGSTQKRDFLSQLGREALRTWPTIPVNRKIQFLMYVYTLVRERQLFVSSVDQRIQRVAEQWGAIGALPAIRNGEDFVSLSESNLGSNKANCCVKRSMDVTITKQGQLLSHDLRVTFQNENPATLKDPPKSWGGAYLLYLRVLLPQDAHIQNVMVGSYTRALHSDNNPVILPEQAFLAPGAARADLVTTEMFPSKGIQSVGFWVLVDAKQSQEVHVTYDLPFHGQRVLRLQKQGGIDVIQVTLRGMRTNHIDLRGDLVVPL